MVGMAGVGIVTGPVTLVPITTLITPMGTTMIFITVIIGEAIVDQQGGPPEKRGLSGTRLDRRQVQSGVTAVSLSSKGDPMAGGRFVDYNA